MAWFTARDACCRYQSCPERNWGRGRVMRGLQDPPAPPTRWPLTWPAAPLRPFISSRNCILRMTRGSLRGGYGRPVTTTPRPFASAKSSPSLAWGQCSLCPPAPNQPANLHAHAYPGQPGLPSRFEFTGCGAGGKGRACPAHSTTPRSRASAPTGRGAGGGGAGRRQAVSVGPRPSASPSPGTRPERRPRKTPGQQRSHSKRPSPAGRGVSC